MFDERCSEMLVHVLLQCQSKLQRNVVETKNFAVTSVRHDKVTWHKGQRVSFSWATFLT